MLMMMIPRTDITLRPNASNKPSSNKPGVINCEINNDIGEKKKRKNGNRNLIRFMSKKRHSSSYDNVKNLITNVNG